MRVDESVKMCSIRVVEDYGDVMKKFQLLHINQIYAVHGFENLHYNRLNSEQKSFCIHNVLYAGLALNNKMKVLDIDDEIFCLEGFEYLRDLVRAGLKAIAVEFIAISELPSEFSMDMISEYILCSELVD